MQQRVGLVLLASVIIGVVVACYGPTEVELRITRDMPCPSSGVGRTGIFVGRPGHGAIDPIAETEDCVTERTEGALEGELGSRIGSLTVVPSDSRDARVTVEIALSLQPKGSPAGTRPKDPKLCLLDATDCIVARRSFTFIPHTSRILPIKLLEECRDRTCLPGTTCIANGCKPDDVDAEDFCDDRTTCNLPPLEAGADGAGNTDAAAAVDARKDARIDAGACNGALDGSVAALADPPVDGLAANATNLFWVAKGGNVYTTSKDGQDPTRMIHQAVDPAGAVVFALDETGNTGWIADNGKIYTVPQASNGGVSKLFGNIGPFGTIDAIAATSTRVHWNNGTYTFTANASDAAGASTGPGGGATFPASRLSAFFEGPGNILFAVDSTGVRRRSDPAGAVKIFPFDGGTDILAVSGGAFIAGTDRIAFAYSADGGVGTLTSASAPRSFAMNGPTLFWIEDETGSSRIFYRSNSVKVLPVTAMGPIVGLAVDTACVYYWADGAIRAAPNK
jgi:hypothetical protein